MAEGFRIRSKWLKWIAEATEGDLDTQIVETLVDTLDAHARQHLCAVEHEDVIPEYIERVRRVGSVLLHGFEQWIHPRDPCGEERLRRLAESSINFILRKRTLTPEQQESEIRNAVERLRLEWRDQGERWQQWRIAMEIRIETRFEARYQHWQAEAIEQVQRKAVQLQSTTIVPRDVKPKSNAHKWEDIEISFLSDERVEIRMDRQIETRNYAEMGFVDRRSGKPNDLWAVLLVLARSGGTIPNKERGSKQWMAIERRIQRTKNSLQRHFGLSDDPLLLIKDIGYRARFKIRLARASET